MAQIRLIHWTLLFLACIYLASSVQDSQDVEFVFRSTSSEDVLNDANVEVGSDYKFILEASGLVSESAELVLDFDNGESTENSSPLLSYTVSNATYTDNKTQWSFVSHAKGPGHTSLVLIGIEEGNETITSGYSIANAFIRFQLFNSEPLNILSQVIGWIYFVAWSISFYPQVYLNWRRKSVVGLNFDFLGLNLTGFLCYTAYNVGLFWIPAIKDEFVEAHPHDIPPVEVNDVVFAIHALALTAITILQVFIYERGGQKMSKVAIAILGLCGLAILILIIIAAVPSVATFNWLSMVNGFSYVKLGITLIKYIPQAWMNFRRKSTEGWSIGNVLLDFTGGTGSIIQMFILAYNFNDWKSIFLNPVKFWLGALSIIFDVIFMVQHYCLYRTSRIAYSDLDKLVPEEE